MTKKKILLASVLMVMALPVSSFAIDRIVDRSDVRPMIQERSSEKELNQKPVAKVHENHAQSLPAHACDKSSHD